MDAYTREQNVVVKLPSKRLVNTVVKAPVISVKLLENEAQELITALKGSESEVALQFVEVLTKQLEAPSEEAPVEASEVSEA